MIMLQCQRVGHSPDISIYLTGTVSIWNFLCNETVKKANRNSKSKVPLNEGAVTVDGFWGRESGFHTQDL